MILTVTMNPAIDTLYMVDGFDKGLVKRPVTVNKTAGGKGLNVSKVARLLGEEVTATGILGGSNGQFIHDEVVRMLMKPEFLMIHEDTRICINIIDTDTGISTEILEKGPVINDEVQKKFLEHFEKLVKDCDVITVSGSLPQGVPSDFYCRLIERSHMENKKLLLDTSGESFKKGLYSVPYMIKPNDDEIADFLGDTNIDESKIFTEMIRFKQMGISLPVITLGGDGCFVGLDDGIYHFYAPRIEVINTVGSGDSFIAGCAVGLSRGYDHFETIKLGMASGMANTQFIDTGKVSLELVEQFIKQITIKKIKDY